MVSCAVRLLLLLLLYNIGSDEIQEVISTILDEFAQVL